MVYLRQFLQVGDVPNNNIISNDKACWSLVDLKPHKKVYI